MRSGSETSDRAIPISRATSSYAGPAVRSHAPLHAIHHDLHVARAPGDLDASSVWSQMEFPDQLRSRLDPHVLFVRSNPGCEITRIAAAIQSRSVMGLTPAAWASSVTSAPPGSPSIEIRRGSSCARRGRSGRPSARSPSHRRRTRGRSGSATRSRPTPPRCAPGWRSRAPALRKLAAATLLASGVTSGIFPALYASMSRV